MGGAVGEGVGGAALLEEVPQLGRNLRGWSLTLLFLLFAVTEGAASQLPTAPVLAAVLPH